MLKLFHGFRGDSDRDALAYKLAHECVPMVSQQVCAAASKMEPAQRRGYVRARSMDIVMLVVMQELNAQGLRADDVQHLLANILDRVVYAVVRELDAQPIVGIPAPHVGIRHAA